MAGDDEDVEVFVNDCMCDFYPSYKPIIIDSSMLVGKTLFCYELMK